MGNLVEGESRSTFQTLREHCAKDFVNDLKVLTNSPSHRILSNKIEEFNQRSTEKFCFMGNKELTMNGYIFTKTTVTLTFKHPFIEAAQQIPSDLCKTWLLSLDIQSCIGCNTDFMAPWSLKHHCRQCGDIFCGKCIANNKSWRKKCNICYIINPLPNPNEGPEKGVPHEEEDKNGIHHAENENQINHDGPLLIKSQSSWKLPKLSSVSAFLGCKVRVANLTGLYCVGLISQSFNLCDRLRSAVIDGGVGGAHIKVILKFDSSKDLPIERMELRKEFKEIKLFTLHKKYITVLVKRNNIFLLLASYELSGWGSKIRIEKMVRPDDYFREFTQAQFDKIMNIVD